MLHRKPSPKANDCSDIYYCVREMEGICVVCNDLTKYTCLKCKVYVCNRGIECLVPVSEDYPGWKSGSSVALCDACDKKETYVTNFSLQETDSEQNDSESTIQSPTTLIRWN